MIKTDWKQATPYLWFCVLAFAMGDLMFGIDSSSFGSLQALPSFLNQFGELQANGTMALSTYRKAIMNSVVYAGRLVGVLIFEPIAERFGYKPILFGISVVQIVAVIIELTAKEWIQFTVARVMIYMVLGMIENAIPSYSAEIAPAPLRGFFAGLFTPLNTISSVWGAGMSQAYATETSAKGWLVPVGVQMIPAVISLGLVWFTVESPRWLISKGHTERALGALKRLRSKRDVDMGLCEAEIAALHRAIEYDQSVNQGSWLDLFRGSMWRRTIYAMLLFFFYQTTGNQFYNAYGPTFLVQVGLGASAFTYAIVVQVVGMVGSIMCVLLTDRTGRRPLCIAGSLLLIIWDFVIGGLGGASPITALDQNMTIAGFILMLWSTKISWATHCYMIAAELGGVRMRKKIIMAGTFNDVVWAFVVSYTAPYIMQSIGGHIGYIFGVCSVISFFFAVFFLPELAGRSLEEVDELFEKPRFRWGWQFKNAKTSGIGAEIAALEGGHQADLSKMTGEGDVEMSPPATETKPPTAHVE